MFTNQFTAGDLMTQGVRTVPADGALADAIRIMDDEGFSQLPVMQGIRPVAMLTETDVRHALQAHQEDLPLLALASPLPALLDTQTRISTVLAHLQQLSALLVTEPETGLLVGIITYWDVLTLSRPFLMVTEVELLLRRVVAAAYHREYGPDWWPMVREDLRRQAEEEHHEDENEPSTPEHMLGHTSFWSLIEMFRVVSPALPPDRFEDLHSIRRLRNQVAHHYRLSEQEQLHIVQQCFAVGDWLAALLRGS